MDSITQMALGAAVAEAGLGPKICRKATLWGAVIGTFPDLDVFVPMGDPVSDFTYHRSFSHSLLVLLLCTPLWVYLMQRFHTQLTGQGKRVAITVYAVLLTHVLLDCFTVYGTQIFWPMSEYPVSIGSIFIVDPLYTLPLLLGTLVFLLARTAIGYKANAIGLTVSTFYLLWTFSIQQYVSVLARDAAAGQGITAAPMLVTPTPFNSLLWRIVVVEDDAYRVGYYSIFDRQEKMTFTRIDSQYPLLTDLAQHPPVQRLQWFTHGFYSVTSEDANIVLSDIRMGIEPDYVFNFIVGRFDGQKILPVVPEIANRPRNITRLSRIWQRIWDDAVAI